MRTLISSELKQAIRLFTISIVLVFCISPLHAQWYTDPEDPYLLPLTPTRSLMVADHEGGAYLLCTHNMDRFYRIFHWNENGFSTIQNTDGYVPFVQDETVPCYGYIYEGGAIVTSDNAVIYSVWRTHNYPTDTYDNRYVKVDSLGNFLWGPVGIVVPEEWFPWAPIVPDNSGGFWLCFGIGLNRHWYLQRFDQNGEMVFPEPIDIGVYPENVITESDNTKEYEKIIPDGLGGVYFRFGVRDYSSRYGAIYVNRFDQNGNRLYENHQLIYESNEMGDITPFICNNGDLFLSWNEQQYDEDQNWIGSKPYITRIDRDLQYVWDDSVKSDPGLLLERFRKYPYTSGGYWETAKHFGTENRIFYHVDSTGTSRAVYDVHIPAYNHFAYFSANDGSAYILKRSYFNTVGRLGTVTKLSPEGEEEWDIDLFRYYEGGTHLWDKYSVCKDNENGFIFVHDVGNGPDGGIVGRATSDGYLGFSPNSVDFEPVSLPDEVNITIYPNPFNPTLTIPFSVPKITDVRIKVYNVLGREVATLLDKSVSIGYHTTRWEAHDFASGIYFVKMTANDKHLIQKVMLLQ